jgi:hypothetical protein
MTEGQRRERFENTLVSVLTKEPVSMFNVVEEMRRLLSFPDGRVVDCYGFVVDGVGVIAFVEMSCTLQEPMMSHNGSCMLQSLAYKIARQVAFAAPVSGDVLYKQYLSGEEETVEQALLLVANEMDPSGPRPNVGVRSFSRCAFDFTPKSLS